MFKQVDSVDCGTDIEGFSYVNKFGEVERVVVNGQDAPWDVVILQADDGYSNGNFDEVYIHRSDIPNLMKALQAAYDHLEA